MKRGQATLFVILGILLFTIIAVSYSYKEEISSKASELGLLTTASLPPQFEEKKTEIENCLRDMLSDAAATVSIRGGFLEPSSALDANGLLIRYYYDKGENKAPTKETVAEEIAKAFNLDAVLCPTVIELAEAKRAESQITIEESKISAKVTMPVTLKIGESTETIKVFEASSKLGLSKLLSAADQMAKTTNADGICINCINDIAEENDIEAEIEPFDGSAIITLIDANSQVRTNPLRLSFAVRY